MCKTILNPLKSVWHLKLAVKNHSNGVWSEWRRSRWYRLFWNQGKGGCSKFHEHNNSRIWKMIKFSLKKSKVFIKNKVKVASRLGGVQWEVVKLGKLLSLTMINWVLEELRVKRFAASKKVTYCRAFCRWVMLHSNSHGRMEKKGRVSYA